MISVSLVPSRICLISASSTTFIPISGIDDGAQRIEDRELRGAALGVEQRARRAVAAAGALSAAGAVAVGLRRSDRRYRSSHVQGTAGCRETPAPR